MSLALAAPANASGIVQPSPDARISAFDERYGHGAHRRLLECLAQPCLSFADIAAEFGVSRERVRKWREAWAPTAPTGEDRRRQCLTIRRRRRLLQHPLFRSFFQQVRAHLSSRRIQLVPTQDGFRARVVLIDQQPAVLTTARALPRFDALAPAYALPPVAAHAVFVYIQLGEDDYLFAPAGVLPARGTTFVDTPSSKYQRYRRTFAAIDGAHAGR